MPNLVRSEIHEASTNSEYRIAVDKFLICDVFQCRCRRSSVYRKCIRPETCCREGCPCRNNRLNSNTFVLELIKFSGCNSVNPFFFAKYGEGDPIIDGSSLLPAIRIHDYCLYWVVDARDFHCYATWANPRPLSVLSRIRQPVVNLYELISLLRLSIYNKGCPTGYRHAYYNSGRYVFASLGDGAEYVYLLIPKCLLYIKNLFAFGDGLRYSACNDFYCGSRSAGLPDSFGHVLSLTRCDFIHFSNCLLESIGLNPKDASLNGQNNQRGDGDYERRTIIPALVIALPCVIGGFFWALFWQDGLYDKRGLRRSAFIWLGWGLFLVGILALFRELFRGMPSSLL